LTLPHHKKMITTGPFINSVYSRFCCIANLNLSLRCFFVTTQDLTSYCSFIPWREFTVCLRRLIPIGITILDNSFGCQVQMLKAHLD
jgi:hypothetical protein